MISLQNSEANLGSTQIHDRQNPGAHKHHSLGSSYTVVSTIVRFVPS